jgi:hypothetical protein
MRAERRKGAKIQYASGALIVFNPHSRENEASAKYGFSLLTSVVCIQP